ncbi:MAG: adenosylmethionine--8-amino-7-oxononanoate transaminase [Deltaproteobacteria bacterium]|nr:adenosylmethionine--8-amino-7-oxononanoate transaminase [Deltaproteobacteria bacterium]
MTASYAELTAWDHTYLWHPFTQMQDWLAEDPIVIARGEGNYLIDVHGAKYLDGVSSLWCNVHGHNHPEINAAITAQLSDIAHSTLLGLANVPSILLAKKLVELTPSGLTRVFYSDAGATAVEIALKLAFQYWQLKGISSKVKFASLVDAYHGDTLGAMSVGYSELFHHYYRPVLTEAFRLTPPHCFRFYQGMGEADALAAAVHEARTVLSTHRHDIAALIVEPLMQGAAGMWAQPVAYVQALREITTECDILLICDEVATGFGRTGRLFACEHAGISPDLFCVAKGITGGYLPLAATLTSEEIFSAFLAPYEEFKTFFHGHTYTGNPLACAAALASLAVFEKEQVLEALTAKIALLTERLRSDFAPLAHVADIRQWGMMAGIELMRDPVRKVPYAAAEKIGMRVITEARKRGILIRPLGNVIVLMPPLSISLAELTRLLDVVRAAIIAVIEDACAAS